MDPVEEVARFERVRLTGAGTAAPHVDRADRPVRDVDDRGTGLPAAAGALMMADEHSLDVAQASAEMAVGVGHSRR